MIDEILTKPLFWASRGSERNILNGPSPLCVL
jgi:hypothetical protein